MIFDTTDLTALTQALVDIESVSGNETEIATAVESTLKQCPHLTTVRIGNNVVARTELGREQRVIVAGHLDTVPVANNLPSWIEGDAIYGRGTCDMKGGVAVALALAVSIKNPVHDVTWIFYDNEEVEAVKNGLGYLARIHPELLLGDFAILMEPTAAGIEGGCQGTLRFDLEVGGVAAHSARSWLGVNAIHAAATVLDTLAQYQPRTVIVEGLEYREGLNAVAISGGIAGNVVPDKCKITVNFRFAPDRDEEDAKQHVQELFHGHHVEFTDFALGARPGLDQPLAETFTAHVAGVPRPKFGWTDVARFSALGIPAINFGPADPAKAHTDDEHCPIAHLTSCYDAMSAWLTTDES